MSDEKKEAPPTFSEAVIDPRKQQAYAMRAIDNVPEIDLNDPAQLEAWYGSGSVCFYEAYRKVVLASCKEIVRARATLSGKRITEDRAGDLARLHPSYLDYLAKHLDGRKRRERAIMGRMGA